MTLSPASSGLQVSVTIVLNADDSIDYQATQAAIDAAIEDRFAEEMVNRSEINQILNKYAGDYVTTDTVLGKIVSKRERDTDVEFSLEESKAVKDSLMKTLEGLKASGRISAKPGKNGGMQTAMNEAAIIAKAEAAKEAKKKLAAK